MKRIILALLASFVGIALFAAPANAADSVDEAIAALKTSNVYVASDAPGATSGTTGYIKQFTTPGDHIVIVMLGTSSMSDQDAADKILGSLKEPSILGMSVNGHLVTASHRPGVPSTEASAAMANAQAISMNHPETLATYVRLVHQYQAAHPEPITSTGTTVPGSTPEQSVVPYGVGGGSLLIALAVVIAIIKRRRGTKSPYTLKASPTSVRDQLNRIKALMPRIRDRSVVGQLGSVINDTEAFFRRSNRSNSRDTEREAADFQRKLKDAVVMLEKYVDIQDNPRYFDHPDQLLASGAEAVDGLAVGILNAVKSSDTKSLLDYKVSSDVLSAERYK